VFKVIIFCIKQELRFIYCCIEYDPVSTYDLVRILGNKRLKVLRYSLDMLSEKSKSIYSGGGWSIAAMKFADESMRDIYTYFKHSDVPVEKACRSALIPDSTSHSATLSIVSFDGANVFATFSADQCLPMVSRSAFIFQKKNCSAINLITKVS
jgi:hypothetical protein